MNVFERIGDIISGLFGPPDPSEAWRAEEDVPLVVDLARGSVNGVSLGDSASALEAFGKPGNHRPFRRCRFVYPRLGVVFETVGGKIDYVGLPVVRREYDDVGPCRFEVILTDGSHLWVDGENEVVPTIIERLGAPAATDRDEDETLYEFELPRHGIELECSPDGACLWRLNLLGGG